MTINYTRISAPIFLLFFLVYSYLAGEIQVFAFDEHADFNARTFPKFISYLGIAVSFLTLVLSRGEDDEPFDQFEWLKVFVLFVLVFTYGIIIKSVGFFLSTNLFLLISYYYLTLGYSLINILLINLIATFISFIVFSYFSIKFYYKLK